MHLFECSSGKSVAEGSFKHGVDIQEIGLNAGSNAGRQLAIVDKNRDLFLSPASKCSFKKLGAMIESFTWNDENVSPKCIHLLW